MHSVKFSNFNETCSGDEDGEVRGAGGQQRIFTLNSQHYFRQTAKAGPGLSRGHWNTKLHAGSLWRNTNIQEATNSPFPRAHVLFTRHQVMNRLRATRDRQMHVHRWPPFSCLLCPLHLSSLSSSTAVSGPLRDKVSLPELHTDPDLILPETGAALFYTLPTMRALALHAARNATPGLSGIRYSDTVSQIKWDIHE